MSTIPSRQAIFNNWNFNNVAGLQVYALDLPGQPKKSLNIYPVARANKRKVSSAFNNSYFLTIGVYITANTRDLLEQSLDTLFANIQAQEGTLTVPKSGSQRNYTATYESFRVNNQMANTTSPIGNTVDLTLIFECSDSYGYDIGPTLITNTLSQTTSPVQFAYTQGGGAEWQVPRVQVSIKALTGGTSATVSIGNLNTGQQINITQTFNQYDLIVVDSRTKSVQVNNVDNAFTGAFPEFNIGSQTLTYSDTFTTRTCEIYANVINRWN